MSIGIGTTSSLSSTSGVSDASTLIQKALGLSTSTSSSKSRKIIDSMKSEIESKQQQYEQINDLLLLIDIDLDMYDELITNIDTRIPTPIQEINTKITAVQDAYRNRVNIGCKNDLHWVLQSTQTVSGIDTLGNPFSKNYKTYKVEKIASEYRQINYYGAKYYKRPKDRDYGSSAVKEIPSASVGIGSTYMVVYDATTDTTGFTILSGIQTGDTITDSIEQPTIFTIGDLPEVVGFGSTSLLGISTTFGGTIAFGSTILAYAGINTTSGISTGDAIWKTGITSTDSVVVGFGTTTISVSGIDTAGVTTSFQIDTTSIILSKPAIASTSQSIFNVGIYTSYPTIFISETSLSGTADDNFFIIRQTGSTENFDPTTNGENPVEIGLVKDTNKTGYGHIIQLINNGSPDVTKTYTEDVDPEPSVGGGFAFYYEGNESWPGVLTPILSGVPPVVTGYTFSYATEGQTLTTITGVGSTAISSGIGYTGTSALGPSGGTCSVADAAIATAESELVSIKNTNLPVINDYISKSATLRTIRDSKQSKAWAYRRGRGAINNELKQLQTDSNVLEGIDFDEFE
jgi:hypothetical protein